MRASDDDPRTNCTVRIPIRLGSTGAGPVRGSGATTPGGYSGYAVTEPKRSSCSSTCALSAVAGERVPA